MCVSHIIYWMRKVYLYKTDIDREQRKDVSDKEPEIYERMKRYSNWFKG